MSRFGPARAAVIEDQSVTCVALVGRPVRPGAGGSRERLTAPPRAIPGGKHVMFRLLTRSRVMAPQALDLPMLSTDLSDHLVRKGVPFREAHHVAGSVVKEGETRGCSLDALTPQDLRNIHPLFGDDAASSGPGGMWDYEAAVERRQTIGGTSRNSVHAQVHTQTHTLLRTRNDVPGWHWGGSCSAVLCRSHCWPLPMLMFMLMLLLMLMLCYADQGAPCLAGPALMPCPCPSRCLSLLLDLPRPVENRADMASEP